MNWDQRERQWKQWSGTAMLHWEKIRNDDIATVAGMYDELIGRGQENYGIVKERVNRQGDEFKKIVKQLNKSNSSIERVQTSLRKKMKADEISMTEKSIEKTITMNNRYAIRMINNFAVNTENLFYTTKHVVIHFHRFTLGAFMKTSSTASILNQWMRFLSAMLVVAFMVPAAIAAGPTTVNLGTSGDFVILAKTGITTTGATSITGTIGVSPIAATAITGFGLKMDASGTFSISSLVTGNIYAANYTSPTPAKLITAVSDMQTAYTDAAGRTIPDHTDLYAGDVTGKTLTSGLYKWGTGVLISAGGVTLSGSASDVWIFQIAQDLTVTNGAIVTVSGGALASNIFWQVAGKVTIGTTAAMKGIILCQTQIAMQTGATLNGRALAQTAVTLIANTFTQPATVAVTPPIVSSTDLANAAIDVALNHEITATFSVAMDPSTITASTFILMQGTTSVSGIVSCSGTTAIFAPASNFAPNTLYTATITTGAKDLAGNALANDYVWSFTTGAAVTAVGSGLAPHEFALMQNYPNPFNPSTKIQYSLEKAGMVSLKIYNVLRLEVATLINAYQEANSYTAQFNTNEGGLDLSSGVYFYRLEAGSFVSTKRLNLVK